MKPRWPLTAFLGTTVILGSLLTAGAWFVAPIRFPEIEWHETPETQRMQQDVERLQKEYQAAKQNYKTVKARSGKKNPETESARQKMEAARKAYEDLDYDYGWKLWSVR